MGTTEMEVEPEPDTLEEARNLLRELRERHRSQAHQILSWRRRAKAQEELLARLARDHAEQLRGLSSQLLLFEARLCRRQKDIRMLLTSRETCISRHARTIRALQLRLSDAGLDASLPDPDDLEPGTPTGLGGGDNDSDSAVILEDGSAMDLQLVLPLSSVLRYNSANAAVQRSISDATKFSSSGACGKRGSNSFLRRPEVLETVYSVEEDQDTDVTTPATEHVTTSAATSSAIGIGSETPSPRGRHCHSDSDSVRTAPDTESEDEQTCLGQSGGQDSSGLRRGSCDRIVKLRRHPPLRSRRAVDEDEPPAWNSPPGAQQQVTYNRVMGNNHRSVTKPRDVKYKRINKAKSKSLEELRGRLKTWVDPGSQQKQLSMDQSLA